MSAVPSSSTVSNLSASSVTNGPQQRVGFAPSARGTSPPTSLISGGGANRGGTPPLGLSLPEQLLSHTSTLFGASASSPAAYGAGSASPYDSSDSDGDDGPSSTMRRRGATAAKTIGMVRGSANGNGGRRVPGTGGLTRRNLSPASLPFPHNAPGLPPPVLGARQIRGAVASLLPSEVACTMTSVTHQASGSGANTGGTNVLLGTNGATPAGGGNAPLPPPPPQRMIVTPPPHISKSALRKAVALVRFILFPDYLWQPERHRHVPSDAYNPMVRPIGDETQSVNPQNGMRIGGGASGSSSLRGGGDSASSSSATSNDVAGVPYDAVPHFFERSLLADSRVSERHRVLRLMVSMLKCQDKVVNSSLREAAQKNSTSTSTSKGNNNINQKGGARSATTAPPPPPPTPSSVDPAALAYEINARERDEAVLAALIRLTEILEVQIYRGFLAVAYEDGIRGGNIHSNRVTTARPVRKEGNNGGRPKFDLNWLPDLDTPTECARVAANGNACVCSSADPAALRVRARNIAMFLIERLPKLRVLLHLDVEAVFMHDVAAHSIGEVVLCYPGIYFMAHQRLAHELYLLGAPNHVTRLLTEIAHTKTGIDIHPHTSIGHSFFMDHCTGIVVGATSIIGNRVSIYQGVTLGAKAFPLDPVTGEKIKNLPRHPIIEDDVTIYANASVLGRVTIGAGSVIGGNVWLARSVPPNTTVLQGATHLKIIPAKTREEEERENEAKRNKKRAAAAAEQQRQQQQYTNSLGIRNVTSAQQQLQRKQLGEGGYPIRDVAEVSDEAPDADPFAKKRHQADATALSRHRAAHLLGESFNTSHL